MQEHYKKLLRLAVIIGSVYLCFRFLLPLFFPFLLAYSIAVVLRKPVRFFWKKWRIRPVIGGTILLTVVVTIVGGSAFYATKLLLRQFAAFAENYEQYSVDWNSSIEAVCGYLDTFFRLNQGRTFGLWSDGLDGIMLFFQEELIPFLTRNSLKAAVSVTELAAAVIIIFVAVLLFLSEMTEKKKDTGEPKMLYFIEKEWNEVKHELSGAGVAYVKTQVILILLVSATCCLGLFLIKNPYALLFGVAIGIFDAFPVLGSGLILVPWAVVRFFKGMIFDGAVLLTLYGICQFLREYLEPKLLGGKLGTSPVNSLMAIYIGYELFGIMGLFLGPFGLVLIKSLWRVTS